MNVLLALLRPAVAAAVGAVAFFVVTVIAGTPSAAFAIAFFVAFFVADIALRFGGARPGQPWRIARFSGPGGSMPMTPSAGTGPFDRFDDRAKRVLALAQDEAIHFQHGYIGPEHVLLGLVREGEGIAARVLDSLGLPLSKIRSAVETRVGRGRKAASPSEIGLAPQTKKLFELALDEARKAGHNDIGTDDLLLGLIGDEESAACQILRSLGVPPERVRNELIATMGVTGEPEEATRGVPLDRFSERGKHVLDLARAEAVRLNHNYIGTEHLLLGLVRDGDGAGARALIESGIDLDHVREAVGFIIGRGDSAVSASEITLSPRAKKVIHYAIDEGRRGGQGELGTGHLLLGLVREGEGIAMGIIDSMNVDRGELQKRARERIAEGLA